MSTPYFNKSFARGAKLVALVTMFGSSVCSGKSPKYDQTLRLGGQPTSETLNLFKTRFPKSACGTPLEPEHINRHTLDDPDNSDSLVCCIDDPKEVAVFSRFKILSRDHNSPVLVRFYRKRLDSITFAVDATSVETILPKFIKLYGPIQSAKALATDTVPVRFASWTYLHVVLELHEELLKYNNFEIKPPPTDRSPKARIVILDLYRIE
jgi:hypothetical protein